MEKKIKERDKKQIKEGRKYTGLGIDFFLTLLVLWMHTTLFYSLLVKAELFTT